MFRLFQFFLALILIAPGAWAETLPAYQPANVRQVCAPAALLDQPGGAVIGQLDPGMAVTIDGIGFDASGQGFLRIESQGEPGFAEMGPLYHFCAPVHPLLAPPNSCHLVLARRASLEGVNEAAARSPDFLPMMTAYRTRDGYALTAGPISLLARSRVLSSDRLPEGADCETGADFTAPLDRIGDRFEMVPDTPPAEASNDAQQLLRWRCQQGEAADCARYSQALGDIRPRDDALEAEMARFDLLGCMAGRALSCQRLMESDQGWINKPVFTALPNAGSGIALIEPELGKIGCDAGRVDSCLLLGRPELQFKTHERGAHLTAFLAYLHACRKAGGWTCEELAGLIDVTPQVLDASLTADDEYALAEALFSGCDLARASRRGCNRAFTGFTRFAEAQTGDTTRDGVVYFRLRDGCAANNVIACVGVSKLERMFSVLDRRMAAARALELCEERGSAGAGCGSLAYTLSPDLPEARAPQQAKFDEEARKCAEESGLTASQACKSALSFFRDNLSSGPEDFPEQLLRENCSGDRIHGCAALASAYSVQERKGPDGQAISWPGQPDQRLRALQAGCKAGSVGMENCESLGWLLERQGDAAGASAAYAMGCTSAMTLDADPLSCYSGGKHALNNTRDYDTAGRYFTHVCDSDDLRIAPYACKYLGQMAAAGQGGDVDPSDAMAQFQRACFHDRVETVDGEGCLLYGRALIENRAHLDWDETTYGLAFVPGHDSHPEIARYGLSRASHAFLRGCRDGIGQACDANRALLAAWSAGDYPRAAAACRVTDAAGRVTSQKDCGRFRYHVLEFEGDGAAEIFVWPDGDRTVTNRAGGDWRLNGGEVSDHRIGDGWECWTNARSGNSFCADYQEVVDEY
ncbi:hypothetical protein [Paracoccus xiamenensis]|uniref:hypothetical protein n=1 Tax=Paracoccus xiamenensis TaxID=2714901 RepID=UPI00140AB4D8|nr:hypothetical protein [Paracoccus xiamenensis]NHF72377.1 hypothetical protein [Paracoccus xiamenensis]